MPKPDVLEAIQDADNEEEIEKILEIYDAHSRASIYMAFIAGYTKSPVRSANQVEQFAKELCEIEDRSNSKVLEIKRVIELCDKHMDETVVEEDGITTQEYWLQVANDMFNWK